MPILRIQSGARLEVGSGSLLTAGPKVSGYDTLILASSPIAYYKMDETSGLVMVDSSGNGNDGDYDLPVTLGSTGVTNDGGTSVAFSGGAGSFANITPGVLDVSTATSPITIEGWFNTGDTVGPLVAGRGPTGTPIIGVYMGNNGVQAIDGRVMCIIRGNTGPLATLVSPLTYNDNSDHYFAMVMEAVTKVWTLYIDGASVITAVHGLGNAITTNDPQIAEDAISNGGSPHFSFAGRIDNVAVYSTALSAPTVLAHYNAGL
jgi:hypothetical protein